MNHTKLTCQICGAEFESSAANAKYCSTACRLAGRRRSRKDWEEKSGYKEKQRKKMQEYREQAAKDAAAAEAAAEKRAATNKKRQATRRRNDETAKLLQAIERGDPLARCTLALKEYGIRSAEYWEAYKAYILNFTDAWNAESAASVNGIPINNPLFGLSVSMSIEELGYIETNNPPPKQKREKKAE